jgi:hypothetical protein
MLDQTVAHFVEIHSLTGLKRFLDKCNKGDKLQELAVEFNIPRSSVSRIRNKMFKRVYVLKEGAIDYLNYKAELHQWIQNEHKKMLAEHIQKETELKHIAGGLNALSSAAK